MYLIRTGTTLPWPGWNTILENLKSRFPKQQFVRN